MMTKILIKIAEWLCPAAAKLGKILAAFIAKQINKQPQNRRLIIAKIAMIGRSVSTYCESMCAMLEDAVIDAAEEKRIADCATPAIQQCKDLMFNKLLK